MHFNVEWADNKLNALISDYPSHALTLFQLKLKIFKSKDKIMKNDDKINKVYEAINKKSVASASLYERKFIRSLEYKKPLRLFLQGRTLP